MAYIDTSVLAAYYCPEPLSPVAQAALGRVSWPVISPLVEVELFSAVAAKVRAGDFDKTDARRVLAMFRRHLDEGHYRVIPIGAREYAVARDWLGQFKTSLRALDSLHLATAFAGNLRLMTCDRRLARAAALLRVKCSLIV